MVDYTATSGLFGIIKYSEDSYFLYWCDSPIKHLTEQELGDLKLLLNTV